MSSDESDEKEAFEVTDFDLENEFDHSRRRRKMTKNDMIYGVFNEESDDDDGEDRGRGGGKRRKDYSKPVSFVSGGIAGKDKKKKGKAKPTKRKGSDDDATLADILAERSGGDDEDDEGLRSGDEHDDDDENASDDEVIRRGLGLGFKGEGSSDDSMEDEDDAGDEAGGSTRKRSATSSKGPRGKQSWKKQSADQPSSQTTPASRPPQSRTQNPFANATSLKSSSTDASKENEAFAQRVLASVPQQQAAVPPPPPRPRGQKGLIRKSVFAREKPAGEEGATEDKPQTFGYSVFGSNKPNKLDKDFAKFEEHSKGIGSKLLAKMGWTPGEGLGRGKQGIATPIDVVVRAKGQALQETGERTKQSREIFAKKDEPQKDSDEEFHEQLDQWRIKDGSDRKKKPKYTYMEPGQLTPQAAGTLKIVDMTGPSARVVDKYADLKGKTPMAFMSGIDQSLPMPELQHNIKVIVEIAANDVRDCNKRLIADRDKCEALRIERDKVSKQLATETKHIERLQQIMHILEECQESAKKGELSIADAIEIFATLQTQYREEYQIYGLAPLAEPIVFPLIERSLQTWNVMKAPMEPVVTFRRWKTLLHDPNDDRMRYGDQAPQDDESMTLFDRLCWNVLMPKLRPAINMWNPRVFEPVIRLLEGWDELLPAWIRDNILYQLVLPRLRAVLETWDPRVDSIPVHSWIIPWLPVLGSQLDSLYSQIRYKLGVCLQAWDPSDPSAKVIIEPWKPVFAPQDMSVFLNRCIVPKLTQAMRALTINPKAQVMDQWNWVMNWRNLISLDDILAILDEHFFPKFLSVLVEWLSTSNPNFKEVSQWYTFWKKQFDAELAATSLVKSNLARALDMMNRAVADSAGTTSKIPSRPIPPPQAQPPPPPPPVGPSMMVPPPSMMAGFPPMMGGHAPMTPQPPFVQQPFNPLGPSQFATAGYMPPQASMVSSPIANLLATQSAAPSVRVSDLIQRAAETNGILYIPKPVRTADGKLLYNFGKVLIYIDREVIFAKEKAGMEYRPVSLQELVQIAK